MGCNYFMFGWEGFHINQIKMMYFTFYKVIRDNWDWEFWKILFKINNLTIGVKIYKDDITFKYNEVDGKFSGECIVRVGSF